MNTRHTVTITFIVRIGWLALASVALLEAHAWRVAEFAPADPEVCEWDREPLVVACDQTDPLCRAREHARFMRGDSDPDLDPVSRTIDPRDLRASF